MGLIGKLIEIYKDDLMNIYNKITQHIYHLRVIFKRCREYGISLNPKKYFLEWKNVNCWDTSFLRIGSWLTLP
jgi:hypothetical protein